jgi:cytochrome c6
MSTEGNRPRVLLSATVLAALLSAAMPSHADEAGEKLYQAKCAACHGADGKGETAVGKASKIRDLGSAEAQKQGDADLAGIITSGKNKMPGYGKSLKPEQIKDLVTYIRGLKRKA